MKMGRKVTGGKYHKLRKRKSYENRNNAHISVLGETKTKKVRTMGGNIKMALLRTNEANLSIAPGKIQKSKIINVAETPQNRFFSRENKLMQGAIIETEKGKAKITNRPSQDGYVNAVLIK